MMDRIFAHLFCLYYRNVMQLFCLDVLLFFALLALEVRAAFSEILLSHASISASSETGETVIAGDIADEEVDSSPW